MNRTESKSILDRSDIKLITERSDSKDTTDSIEMKKRAISKKLDKMIARLDELKRGFDRIDAEEPAGKLSFLQAICDAANTTPRQPMCRVTYGTVAAEFEGNTITLIGKNGVWAWRSVVTENVPVPCLVETYMAGIINANLAASCLSLTILRIEEIYQLLDTKFSDVVSIAPDGKTVYPMELIHSFCSPLSNEAIIISNDTIVSDRAAVIFSQTEKDRWEVEIKDSLKAENGIGYTIHADDLFRDVVERIAKTVLS